MNTISSIWIQKDGLMMRAWMPKRAELEALRVGDEAPDCFGTLARITKIYAAQEDVNGKFFICYYTQFGPSSHISNSLKEGEILRTPNLPSTMFGG